ncbi:MAG: hypothetical protein AAGG68_10915 [Bacteroidota bacterium]
MKKHYNRVRRYLSGRMSTSESKKLEAELSYNKALREELNAQRLERKIVQEEQEKEAYFRSIINKVKRKIDGEEK